MWIVSTPIVGVALIMSEYSLLHRSVFVVRLPPLFAALFLKNYSLERNVFKAGAAGAEGEKKEDADAVTSAAPTLAGDAAIVTEEKEKSAYRTSGDAKV